MSVTRIGIITAGGHSQADVNNSHAADIARALGEQYKVALYDLSNGKGFDQFIRDVRRRRIDLVFNNAAGKQGGDGTVEGLLEILDVPFVGSDTLATAIAFDKKSTKTIVAAAGVPVVRGITLNARDFIESPEVALGRILKKIRIPLIVKASQGSDSIGVSLVKEENQLITALRIALREDDTILVEDFVRRKAEVTCMVIGNGPDTQALEPVERVYDTDILYPITISDRSYRFPNLPKETIEKIKEYSITAHRSLGCSDYSRSDFLIGKRGGIYFLELNAHAGLGNVGPTAFAAKHTKGWSYKDMLDRIIEAAIARQDL